MMSDPVLDYELNHRDSLSLPREKRALTVAAERREALKAKQRLVAKAKAAKAALSGLAGKCFHGDVGRTAEFAETLQIPSFDVFSGKPFRLEDYWSQPLFERFNRAYYARYREMRLFLDENGVDHRMHDETAATRPAIQAMAA